MKSKKTTKVSEVDNITMILESLFPLSDIAPIDGGHITGSFIIRFNDTITSMRAESITRLQEAFKCKYEVRVKAWNDEGEPELYISLTPDEL